MEMCRLLTLFWSIRGRTLQLSDCTNRHEAMFWYSVSLSFLFLATILWIYYTLLAKACGVSSKQGKCRHVNQKDIRWTSELRINKIDRERPGEKHGVIGFHFVMSFQGGLRRFSWIIGISWSSFSSVDKFVFNYSIAEYSRFFYYYETYFYNAVIKWTLRLTYQICGNISRKNY